jgi:predicted HicB family RNase H-like nuclease
MSKPNYRASVTFDPERKVFLARAPELEHCSGEGATRAEAIARLEEEIDAQLANMLSHGSTPPRAVDEESFSGEIAAKVSKVLHRELAYQARSEGIDLDHLVGELLAAAMESRKQTRGLRGGNRAPQEHLPNDNVGNRYDGGRQRGFGGRGGNAHLLDDRANFIEYVRGLEQGGNGGGAGRHGGGHNNQPGGGRRRGRGGRGGGNPNHQQHRGMHGGCPRPQHAGNGNNGNFAGNGNSGGSAGSYGGDVNAASDAPPPSRDPDSSGNA